MGRRTATAEVMPIGGDVPTNGGKGAIEFTAPYAVEFTIKGTCPILLHAWNVGAVKEKSTAAKGSKGKKTDDVESYVYRDDDGFICIPGQYPHAAMCEAGRYMQDPRSPRKSARDLMKGAVSPLTLLASLGTKTWDYEDERRVVIQRNGINRVRPAFREGWLATFQFQVNLPEYVSSTMMHECLALAGRVCGIGDFRPTYGRFNVVNFEVLED